MKRFLTALLAAAVAGALFVAAPLGAAPKGTNHNNSAVTSGTCSDAGDTITILAPEKLWPPNHKYFDDLQVVVTDDDAQEVTLTTRGTHDQYDGDTEQNGAGHTADDIVVNPLDEGADRISADGAPEFVAEEIDTSGVTTDWVARAERTGRDEDKGGRIYTLTGDSLATNGDTCHHSVTFNVPHDMRRSNR